MREARGQTAHAPLPTELPGRAELWPQLCAELLEAWADAGLSDDERLAGLSATDVILLAVAVAPSLDRTTARRYRATGGGNAREPLGVGLLLDLAGGSAAVRVRMARRLARDLPLRAGGVLLAGSAPIPSVNEELAVAPWFLAACYGE